MFNCENTWLKAQSLLSQSYETEALTQMSYCFEQGIFHPKMVHVAAQTLDQQGSSVQALHLIEMATRHHVYHPKLELLKASLIEARDLPGSLSPLAFLNHHPAQFAFISMIVLCLITLVLLWKVSPLKSIILEKALSLRASLAWFENSLVGILTIAILISSFISGVNYWDDYQNQKNPAFMIRSTNPLYEKSIGVEAVAQVQGGQLGKLVNSADFAQIPMYYPGKILQEVKASERSRVKVVFSSGQSGYLWVDQILLLEKQK